MKDQNLHLTIVGPSEYILIIRSVPGPGTLMVTRNKAIKRPSMLILSIISFPFKFKYHQAPALDERLAFLLHFSIN